MHPILLKSLLDTFKAQQISVYDFISSIVLRESKQIHWPEYDDLRNDVLANSTRIFDCLSSVALSEDPIKKWVHERAKALYLCEARHLSSKSSGFHFDAHHAQAHQVLGFDASALITQVSSNIPLLWDLLRTLTSQTEQSFHVMEGNSSLQVVDVVSNSMYFIQSL